MFDSSVEPVTRNEFEAFAQPLLRENAAIGTLSWVPRVLDSERAEHERWAVRQGLPGYRIKAMGADGNIVPSPEEREYFPVFYATLPSTSPLYGLDLRSEPAKLVELERARDTDRLGFSTVATLVTTGGTEGGFLFSLPIYKRGSPHDTIEDRRRNIAGFVHGSLITARMIDGIIADTKTPKGLDLFFFAPDGGPQAVPFYMHPSRLRTSPPAPLSRAAAAAGCYWSRDLEADGLPWLTMVARPMPNGPLTVHHDRAWIVLAFGLILTGAVVTYIRSSRSHALRMMRINQKILRSCANGRADFARQPPCLYAAA